MGFLNNFHTNKFRNRNYNHTEVSSISFESKIVTEYSRIISIESKIVTDHSKSVHFN